MNNPIEQKIVEIKENISWNGHDDFGMNPDSVKEALKEAVTFGQELKAQEVKEHERGLWHMALIHLDSDARIDIINTYEGLKHLKDNNNTN